MQRPNNNNKRRKTSSRRTVAPAAGSAPAWAALQEQLSASQRSLQEAEIGRRRLRTELISQLRQQQTAIVGSLSSLLRTEPTALRAELAACGNLDARPAGGDASGDAARRRPASSLTLSCLPDELMALAMSFVLTRTRQWRDLSLVCRQFQRCCLLPDAHEHLSLVVGTGAAAHLATIARSLSGLRVVDAGGMVTDVGMFSVMQLTLLQSLNLSNCDKITDDGLVTVAQLTSLQSLDLSGCNRITDAGMDSVAQLRSLQSLNLSGIWKITGAGMHSVGQLTSLHTLDLSGCYGITNEGMLSVVHLTSLHTLDLSWCDRITDAGMLSVAQLTSLQSLKLSGCQITDSGLDPLAQLYTLRSLNLMACQITYGAMDRLKATRLHGSWLEITY